MINMTAVLRRSRQVLAGLVVLGAVVAVAVLLVIPQATGGAALTVLSGSMTPTYPVGSVVVVRPVQPSDVRVDDVITYATPGSLTTHRVIALGEDEQGQRTFITKGDANRGEDKDPVVADAVRGRVWFHVPFLGRIRELVSSPWGLATIVVLAGGVAGWDRMSSALRKRRPVSPQMTPEPLVAGKPPAPVSDAAATSSRVDVSDTLVVPTGRPQGRPAVDIEQQLLVARVAVEPRHRGQVVDILGLTRGHVVAVSPGQMIVAIAGTVEHLDGAESLLRPYGVIEMQRSAPVVLLGEAPRPASLPPTEPASGLLVAAHRPNGAGSVGDQT